MSLLLNNGNLNLSNLPTARGRRTASKTVRSNTRFYQKTDGKRLPKPICVNVDWFSFMADLSLPAPILDEPLVFDDGNVVLMWSGKGGGGFDHLYDMYVYGEMVGNLLSGTRNPKIFKPGVVKVEILNHVHYSNSTVDIYEQIIKSTRMVFRNVTRLDISIDGNNELYYFLNAYAKQTLATAKIHKLGRARFDTKVMEKFMYQSFKIGTGHKYITVYNKSREIRERSHKEYIVKVWEQNGLIERNSTGEIISDDNWRAELRLTSQAVKEFKDLDITKLKDYKYLLTIFRTAANTLMDFVIVEDDKNLSRCRRIDLFDFYAREVGLLEKVPRHKVEGNYKAKMAIHNAVKDLIQGYLNEDESKICLQEIHRQLTLYDLWAHYNKKLPEWIDKYRGIKYTPGAVAYESQLQLMERNTFHL